MELYIKIRFTLFFVAFCIMLRSRDTKAKKCKQGLLISELMIMMVAGLQQIYCPEVDKHITFLGK